MKTNIIFKSTAMVFMLLLSGSILLAQTREKDEKANQQAAVDAEIRAKKEMLDAQQQVMKEQQKMFEEQNQKMRHMEIIYADQARETERVRSSVRSSGDYAEGFYFSPWFSQNNQSQLTLRNSFNGGSDESKGNFEVDEGTRNVRVMINGKVKSGEIQIIVKYPNGKVFKDLTIDSAAEVSYSQSLTIKDEEINKYIGDWKYEVKAVLAEGNYMLQIMTH